MADKTIDVYLNDHLAGAMLGSDLAEHIRDQNDDTPLGDLMQSLAPQIEEDRRTLIGLMQLMDTSESRVKQAGAWVTDKVSRAKLRGGDLRRAATRHVHGGREPRPRCARETQPVEGASSGRRSVSRDCLGRSRPSDRTPRPLEHERLAAARRALSNASPPRDRTASGR